MPISEHNAGGNGRFVVLLGDGDCVIEGCVGRCKVKRPDDNVERLELTVELNIEQLDAHGKIGAEVCKGVKGWGNAPLALVFTSIDAVKEMQRALRIIAKQWPPQRYGSEENPDDVMVALGSRFI